MNLLVRPAATEEAEDIRNLMRLVVEGSLEREHQAQMIGNANANVDVWLQRPSGCVHLVAVDQDRLVGVIMVKNFWNLCSLFVDPSHRLGVGRTLVVKAIALCKDNSPEQAILLNAAPGAIAFYECLGFAPRESRQALPPGFLAMRLPL